MRTRIPTRPLAAAVIAASAVLLLVRGSARGACAPDSMGLSPSQLTSSRSPFLGHAIGESFYATDTLITKVTVWRPAGNLSAIGAHLFITAVDTTLSPPQPYTGNILLDGPTLLVYDSTPPGGVIEMPFAIDPPLALPRPGYYAWFLQAANCDPGDAWEIGANEANPYPQGIYWITGRALTGCYLAAVEGGEGNTDLLFRIDFCSTATTPVHRETWGGIKVIYR